MFNAKSLSAGWFQSWARRPVVVHCVGLGVALLATWFLWLDLKQTQALESEEYQRVQQLQNQLTQGAKTRAENAKLKKRWSEAKEAQQVRLKELARRPKESEILEQLSNLAKKHALNIERFDRTPASQESTSMSELNFEVQLSGRYPGFCHWLDAMNKMKPGVRIRKMEISSSPGSSVQQFAIKFSVLFDSRSDSTATKNSSA